ncbi:hypothetical protein MSG28_014850, partial [Choristoneura fumiferana]
MSNLLKCNVCNIVIDELLSYVQNKLSLIDDTTLILSTDQRKISRKKSGKEARDLEDIVALLKSIESDKVPIFVARKLEKLPPLTLDHLDCTKLLKDLAKVQRELETIKSSYATITQLEELRLDINNMKYAPLPQAAFSAVNMKRGAWIHDSGPIGLSHCNDDYEDTNSGEGPMSPKVLDNIGSQEHLNTTLHPKSSYTNSDTKSLNNGQSIEDTKI